LWDRSGEPDRGVEALEELLRPLRHSRPALEFPHRPSARGPRAPSLRRLALPLALAATVALLVAGTWMARPDPARTYEAALGQSWTVAPVSGTVTLASQALDGEIPLTTDRWLETGEDSAVQLRAGEVGSIRVGPRSRVRVVSSTPGAHRLALARGSLDAFIWASPRQFFVETPSAVAIDLGCAYRLEVDEDGSGRLRVTAGWVGFELDGRESLVPSGAVCATQPGRGPGTPHFEDATPAFREALAAVDAAGPGADREALERLLREARPRDALSLWHLLSRLGEPAASQVYTRLAALAPPPAAASRARVLARDREALDAWWDSLGFAPVSRFREWMGQ
jgi:hypothetical protein